MFRLKLVSRKGNAVKEEVGEGLRILRLWFFAHDAFTEDAEKWRALVSQGRPGWIAQVFGVERIAGVGG